MDSVEVGTVFFVFFGLLVFLVVSVYLRFKKAGTFRVKADGTVIDMSDSALRRTLMTHLQCLALIQALDVSWPLGSRLVLRRVAACDRLGNQPHRTSLQMAHHERGTRE